MGDVKGWQGLFVLGSCDAPSLASLRCNFLLDLISPLGPSSKFHLSDRSTYPGLQISLYLAPFSCPAQSSCSIMENIHGEPCQDYLSIFTT